MDKKANTSIGIPLKDNQKCHKEKPVGLLSQRKAICFDRIKSKKGSFSMKGKSFFLTYPRSPNGWTKELVRDYLLKRISYCYERKDGVSGAKVGKTKVRTLVVAQETHQDEGRTQDYDRGDIHYHCYLETFEKISINSASYFDIPVELTEDILRYGMVGRINPEKMVIVDGNEVRSGSTYVHGDYQLVKNIMGVINYVKKEGNYLEYGGCLAPTTKVKHMIEATEQDAILMAMAESGGLSLLKMREMYTNVAIGKANSVNNSINIINNFVNDCYKPLRSRPFFPLHKELPIHDGAGFGPLDQKPMAVLLFGDSNTGKSTYAISIAFRWTLLTLSQQLNLDFETLVLGSLTDYAKDFAVCQQQYIKRFLSMQKFRPEDYNNEQILLFDEVTKKDFEDPEVQSFLKTCISEAQACSRPYYGSVSLAWPRKVVLCTNDNALLWNYKDPGLWTRLILLQACIDGSYTRYEFDDKGKLYIVKQHIGGKKPPSEEAFREMWS